MNQGYDRFDFEEQENNHDRSPDPRSGSTKDKSSLPRKQLKDQVDDNNGDPHEHESLLGNDDEGTELEEVPENACEDLYHNFIVVHTLISLLAAIFLLGRLSTYPPNTVQPLSWLAILIMLTEVVTILSTLTMYFSLSILSWLFKCWCNFFNYGFLPVIYSSILYTLHVAVLSGCVWILNHKRDHLSPLMRMFFMYEIFISGLIIMKNFLAAVCSRNMLSPHLGIMEKHTYFVEEEIATRFKNEVKNQVNKFPSLTEGTDPKYAPSKD
jgi:hypothetical protein